jgi:hypothetical protein
VTWQCRACTAVYTLTDLRDSLDEESEILLENCRIDRI